MFNSKKVTIYVVLYSTITLAGLDPKSKNLDRLFEVTRLEESIDRLILKSVEQQLTINPSVKKFEKEILAFTRRNSSFKALEKEIRAIYGENFTEQEVKEVVKFYESSLGKKYLALEPQVTERLMKIGQERTLADLPNFKKEIQAKTEELEKSGQLENAKSTN